MGKLKITYELEHTSEYLELDKERRSIHLSFQKDDQETFRNKVEDYAARLAALSASTPYKDEGITVNNRWWGDLDTKYRHRCGYDEEIQIAPIEREVIPPQEKRDRIRTLSEKEIQDDQLEGILEAVKLSLGN